MRSGRTLSRSYCMRRCSSAWIRESSRSPPNQLVWTRNEQPIFLLALSTERRRGNETLKSAPSFCCVKASEIRACSFAWRDRCGYPWRVLRPLHRRVIVLLALLCQALSTMLVHVPMATAATAPKVATAHCHDHAQSAMEETGGGSGDASDTGLTGSQDSESTGSFFHHHCKTGFCNCVCAHAPAALTAVPAVPPLDSAHPPLISTYRPAAALVRPTPFFRPPI